MRIQRRLAIVAVSVLPAIVSANAQVRYVNGLFVGSAAGVSELIAYAEPRSNGSLRMVSGDLDDVPVIHEISRILSSQPLWAPIGVIVATSEVFRDERAERRQIRIALRQLNVYTYEVRTSDLERREKIDALLKAVRASYDAPGYAFVILAMDGLGPRYYPIRLTPAER